MGDPEHNGVTFPVSMILAGTALSAAGRRWLTGAALLTILLLMADQAAAAPARGLRFDRVGVDQGLSQETVFAIAQDPHGFLWIGTQGGLNRYDGYRFITYRHDAADSTSISDNWIAALCIDTLGRLWVATVSGLDRFDPATNRFIHFQTSDVQPTPRLWALTSDGAGGVWAGTAGGLAHVDRDGHTTVARTKPGDPTSLSANIVRAVTRDAAGSLWVGTTAGLDRLRANGISFDHFPVDSDARPNAARNSVRALAFDRRGDLWIGNEDGLERWSDRGARRRRFGDADGLARGMVGTIHVDDSGTVWVGIFEHGIARWDSDANHFVAYHTDALDGHSIASDVVNTLFTDRSGVLWVGTWFGGLSRTDLAAGGFDRLVHRASDPNSLSENTVIRIYGDSVGRVWLATRAGGLDAFDPRTHRITIYRHNPADPHSISGDFVRALLEDRRGGLWVGTGSGFDRLDPGTGRFDRVVLPWPPGDRDVRILARDPSGPIWMGTGDGLVRYDPERNSAERFTTVRGEPSSLGLPFANALLFDRNRTLWVATFSSGVDRLDGIEQGRAHFTHFHHDPSDPGSLSSNRVYCLFEDHGGTLWIGTAAGLNRATRASNGTLVFTHYGAKEGFHDEQVYGIEEDEHGYLWLGTGGGLTRFDPKRAGVRNYVAADGLIDGTYALGSYFRAPDGTLYFGGFNGVTFFKPTEVHTNPIPPQVALTDLSIFNESITTARPKGFRLDGPLEGATAATFSYRHSVFAIEFAALHYGNPPGNRYAYKLEGFDRDWVRTDSAHRLATYTNLDPGAYRFRVRAASSNGVWNDAGVSLAITITPPFWKTWWFRLLLAVAIVGSLVGWYQARLRHFARQRALLERQVAERTAELAQSNRQLEGANRTLDRQAKDLEKQNEVLAENVRLKDDVERISRHDLRTPLNSIISLAQIMREDAGLPRRHEESLQLIEQAGFRVLNMANLTLDLFKMEQGTYHFTPKAVDIRSIAERALLDLGALRRTHEVTCDIVAADFATGEIPLVQGDELLAHSMLTNLLKNAIEASPRGGHVSVRIVKRESIQIRIHNSGVIPEAVRGRFFEKYATKGKKGGTGLGAYSASLMAATQGGRIRFESSLAAGTTLIVDLMPAHPDDPKDSAVAELAQPGLAPTANGQWPARHILVVDDDANNRAILRTFLSHPCWTVEEAENGLLALEHAKASPYDFILLDIEMPVVDGFEVAAKIRSLPAHPGPRPAIIALSSHDDAETRNRATESGFDRYVTKPVTRRTIVELVLGSVVSQTVTLAADVRHLVPSFVENKLAELQRLQGILARNDAEGLRREFHRLRGSFSLYGFGDAATLCGEMEELARSSQVAQIAERLPALFEYLNRLDIHYAEIQPSSTS